MKDGFGSGNWQKSAEVGLTLNSEFVESQKAEFPLHSNPGKRPITCQTSWHEHVSIPSHLPILSFPQMTSLSLNELSDTVIDEFVAKLKEEIKVFTI